MQSPQPESPIGGPRESRLGPGSINGSFNHFNQQIEGYDGPSEEGDAMNHRIVNRRGTQNQPRPAGRPEGAGFSKAALESKGDGQQAFFEDFNMEHSCSNIAAGLMAFSARTESARAESARTESTDGGASRNPCGPPVNSPSCVYLG